MNEPILLGSTYYVLTQITLIENTLHVTREYISLKPLKINLYNAFVFRIF